MIPQLTALESEILEAFKTKPPGRLFTIKELTLLTYGYTDPEPSGIRHRIAEIRKKLGPDSIITIRGYGYVLGNIEVCKECNGTGWISKS